MIRRVVDTHVHFWEPGTLPYPWLNDVDPGMRSDYLPADLRADIGGLDVVATVHVQAEMDHQVDPALETAWLASLSEQTGTPTVVIGYADLASPDLGEVLDRHTQSSLFRGIRQEAWFDPESMRADVPRENMLDDPAWRRGLRELEHRGLVFDLLVWQWQLEQAASIFADVPELPVVINHTGVPTGDRGQWRDGLRAFAERAPRAVLKISGLGFVDPAWAPSNVDPIIREAIELFGPDRCVFASNFPVDKPGISYEGIWGTFERCTADLSDAEQDAIFRATAMAVYRIG